VPQPAIEHYGPKVVVFKRLNCAKSSLYARSIHADSAQRGEENERWLLFFLDVSMQLGHRKVVGAETPASVKGFLGWKGNFKFHALCVAATGPISGTGPPG
jgi:hypothetical protein